MRFIATIAASIAMISSAHAANMLDCDYLDESRAEGLVTRQKACINGLKAKVAEQESAVASTTSAVQLAWKIAANPISIIDTVEPSVIREGYVPFAARFQKLHHALRDQLNPGMDSSVPDIFGGLRGKYSDPAELKAFYDNGRKSVLGKIAATAVRGIVGDVFNEARPLFEKPLTLTAALAGNWYINDCFQPEADLTDYSKRECEKLKTFAPAFKREYGIEPSGNTAYILSYLYRRHLEGGSALVAQWQEIGKDLATVYALQR